MTRKPIGFFTALGVMALLAACSEKVPNDKLTYETVLSYAKNDELEGLVVDDFKKENGWQDTSSENKYNVRYNYNLKLTKPLPEVVLAFANGIVNTIQQRHKKPGLMGIDALQSEVNISTQADSWLAPQKETFPLRRDAFLIKCKPCTDFLSKGSKDEINLHWNAFIAAWAELEKMGFKDNATMGDKVAKQAWSGFMKTENGWRPIVSQ
ncbi:hypothetical protein [Chromobacterium haemolyticum]|uniref:hypothetical protein n=1 Tax=Chromobacterium haemolyticum TaxID=394935 RepID=UPI00307FB3D0